MNTIDLSCRCGAARLRVEGDPVAQIYCHCTDCRAAHSAAYVASAIYPAGAVRLVQGELTPTVIARTPRLRCAACATHQFSELAGPGLRSVNAFLLPPGAFQPQMHVQCQHALMPVVDDLPHFKGFPAAFGGADERMAW